MAVSGDEGVTLGRKGLREGKEGGRGGNAESRTNQRSPEVSSFFLSPSPSLPLAISLRFSSTGNGNTNFAEYSGWTAVSAHWKTVVWVVIT